MKFCIVDLAIVLADSHCFFQFCKTAEVVVFISRQKKLLKFVIYIILQKGLPDFCYLADLVRALVELSTRERTTSSVEDTLLLPSIVFSSSTPLDEIQEVERSQEQTSTEIATSNVSVEDVSHDLTPARPSTTTTNSTSDTSTSAVSSIATIQSTSSTTSTTTNTQTELSGRKY